MSQYPDAQFLTSANAPHQFLPDDGREVAVVGRSNAGKSSAINAIVNRRQFARVSKTPGRTQLVNFFSLGTERRLVDLPGYGFAKVSDKMRNHWGELLQSYFESRKSISGLLLIVDVRRQLRDSDLQMLALAESVHVPTHVLLTKSDKLKRGQATTALLQVQKQLEGRATAQLFSATKKTGCEEARAVLNRLLESDPQNTGQ